MNDGLLRQSSAQNDGLQAWINRALKRQAASLVFAQRVQSESPRPHL